MVSGTIGLDGRTVARLGFGAMRITGPGIWGEPRDPDEARRVLRRAVELGVTFVDTAHSYGPEVSERLIGETLSPFPDDLVVATKAGLQRGGPSSWVPDGRPQTLRRDVERSLELLRTERLDLLQLHAVDPRVPLEESVGTLVELRDEGKVDLIGLSNVSVDELERARELTPIVSVQNRYSLGDRSSEDVLRASERLGIAFIPWYPLGAGSVADDSAVAQIARNRGATPFQVALAWLLARSPAMLPIPGTSSVAHLEENVAAAGLELSEDELDALAG
ncbi:MAG TPA: aldo/keto reductase [Gaiellaceae bacterium]|nr:aldo/keto reductase [Gaiellaceae bacterium]